MSPSKELQELWTRLVSGSPLSRADTDELARFLSDADVDQLEWLQKDLTVDDGLRAIHAMRSAEDISESETDDFVSRVLQRLPAESTTPPHAVTPQYAVTPPPVVLPPKVIQPPPVVKSVTATNPVHVSNCQERDSKRGQQKWIALAVVASVLTAVGLAVWISGRNDSPENAVADNTGNAPKSNPIQNSPIQSPISPTTDQLERNTPSDQSIPPATVDQNPAPMLADASQQNVESAPSQTSNKPDPSAVGNDSTQKAPTQLPDPPPTLDRPGSPSMNSDLRQIATVFPSPDAVWPDGFDPAKDRIAGPVELLSGTARLRLGKGTELTMKGATKISVIDGNHITLAKGVISATVPEAAIGFEVDAPGGRIIDLGTKFTVQCLPDQGYTLVSVSEGKVDAIQPPINPRARPRKSRLTAGRTKWLPTDSGKAHDWVLNVQFGKAQPSEVTIDGQSLDLVRPESKMNATNLIAAALDDAREQMRLGTRGERFSGLVIVNDASETIVNKRQLVAVGTFISEQIQAHAIAGPKLLSPTEMMQEFQTRMKQMLGVP